MSKRTFSIKSVLGGFTPTQYLGSEGQYLTGIGIDPDYPLTSSDVRTSGVLVPTVYEKFSGSNVTSSVVAIINNPKNTLTYVVLSNGRLISYDSTLGSETLIGTVSGGIAKGGWYYNNYIYIPTGTDVSRYGPLNNSPTLVDGVWTGATLGSLTALTNTTYPTLAGVSIPNHIGFAHGDGSSYFLDFKNGQGFVNRINTRKVTDEGDTNGSTITSAYNVLDLPFGFYPTAITNYSTDIAILAIQTTSGLVNQGRAALFLWDPTNTDTFYRGPIYLPDPIATALLYVNGSLIIWSGNGQNGVRVSQYAGGDSVSDIEFMEEGVPPLAHAVDALGSRIVWGGSTTYPETTASVFAYGSKNSKLPKGLHNIVRTTSTGTTPSVTALRFIQQSSNITPKLVPAWTDGTGSGLDKLSTTATYASVYRSAIINIGSQFNIRKIRLALGAAVAANMTVTPKIYVDDASSSFTLATINDTNYSGKRRVVYKAPQLSNVGGINNFYIELRWTGTVALPILMPIEFEIEIFDDEN